MLTLTVTTAAIAGRMRFLSVNVAETSTDSTGGNFGGGNKLPDVIRVEAKGSGSGSVTIDGYTILATDGVLVGLGNQDVTVTIDGKATATGVNCTNHGRQLVDAQPREFDGVESQDIPSEEFDKNGSTSFYVPIENITSHLSSDQFCPNKNWSAEILGFKWVKATITATQPDGQVITATFERDEHDQWVQVPN